MFACGWVVRFHFWHSSILLLEFVTGDHLSKLSFPCGHCGVKIHVLVVVAYKRTTVHALTPVKDELYVHCACMCVYKWPEHRPCNRKVPGLKPIRLLQQLNIGAWWPGIKAAHPAITSIST